MELSKVYQQKQFERDAEHMIETLRPYKKACERSMGDVGGCANDVVRLSAEFEQFQIAVRVCFK